MRHRVSQSNQQQAKPELDGNRLFSYRRAFKPCLFILYMAAALRPVVILCFNVSHVQTDLQIYLASCDGYFTHYQLTMSSLAVTNGFLFCAIHRPIYGLVHSTRAFRYDKRSNETTVTHHTQLSLSNNCWNKRQSRTLAEKKQILLVDEWGKPGN